MPISPIISPKFHNQCGSENQGLRLPGLLFTHEKETCGFHGSPGLTLTFVLTAMNHHTLISIFKKINSFFPLIHPSLPPPHLHPCCYIHVRTYINTHTHSTHTWSASFPPPKKTPLHVESQSALPAHTPSLPAPPSLPSPLQAKLSHPVRQVSWERIFPKTEMGCECLHSEGQAGKLTAKQGSRKRGGLPSPPLLFGSLISRDCCSAGIFCLCWAAAEPCHYGHPPSLSSSCPSCQVPYSQKPRQLPSSLVGNLLGP